MLVRKLLVAILMAGLLVLRPVALPEALAQSVVLTKGPYLQSVTPTSIIIAWETDQPADSLVKYGPTAEYGSTTSNSTLVTSHSIVLEGLSPYTTYHYRVGTSTYDLSEDSTLKTAAPPSPRSPSPPTGIPGLMP